MKITEDSINAEQQMDTAALLQALLRRVKGAAPPRETCSEPGEFCDAIVHYNRDPVERGFPGDPLEPPVVIVRAPFDGGVLEVCGAGWSSVPASVRRLESEPSF